MRQCIECKRPVNGRSDKKFCDDGCRNTYNNRLNSQTNLYVKSVNKLLRKNRNILQHLMPAEGKVSISEKTLKILGFQFDYHTHVYETRSGSLYRFCYEYGYLKIDEGVYVLVRKQQGQSV